MQVETPEKTADKCRNPSPDLVMTHARQENKDIDELKAMKYKEYKCVKCGWVHAAIPLADAQSAIDAANAARVRQWLPINAGIEQYLKCFGCGASTKGFIPAEAGDAPRGSTLQAVVVPEEYFSKKCLRGADYPQGPRNARDKNE